jgi:hypothetical protein
VRIVFTFTCIFKPNQSLPSDFFLISPGEDSDEDSDDSEYNPEEDDFSDPYQSSGGDDAVDSVDSSDVSEGERADWYCERCGREGHSSHHCTEQYDADGEEL